MYRFLCRFFLVVILVMSGAMTHAGMAFAAYEPVAVDDSVTAYFYDEDSVITDPEPEVVNPRGSAEAEVLKNDQFAAGSSGKTPWLINAAGERVQELKTDHLTCKVKESRNDTIYIGCELSFDDAYSDETFRVQYVAEDTLGRFSQPATLSVYTDTFTRDEAADESFSMREARPISFNWPGTYDKESNSVCIGKDIDDLKICEDPFLVKRVVKPGEGTWKTSHTPYAPTCCRFKLWFIFRPEDGFQGTSDLFVRHRDGGKNRVVKYSVTVNPSGGQDNFGTLPIAHDVKVKANPWGFSIFEGDQRGSRGARVVGGKFVNPDGSLTEEITVNGVRCSRIVPNYGPWFAPELQCDYKSATADTVTMKYVVIDEIDQVSKPATITITDIKVVDSESCFSDVQPNDSDFSDIQWACHKGLATGWPVPGAKPQFRPALGVQRDAAAAFFYRTAGSPEFTPPARSPFSDLKPTDEHYKEITWAAEQGITKGWDDGTFRPRQIIKRDAFAAFTTRFLKQNPSVPDDNYKAFIDVDIDHPFYAQMYFMRWRGWMDAAGREFRPNDAMDRASVVKTLYRVCSDNLFGSCHL